MAESKKTAAPAEKMVRIIIKKQPGSKAEKESFYSVNFKNYIIKHGEYVDVPESIAKMIEDNDAAVAEADAFSEQLKENENRKE